MTKEQYGRKVLELAARCLHGFVMERFGKWENAADIVRSLDLSAIEGGEETVQPNTQDALITTLNACKEKFNFYAEQHAAKGPGHEEKERVNREMVAMIDSVISRAANAEEAKPEPVAVDRDAIRDAVAQSMTCLYYCGRVWSAWQVGTMSEDDFTPAADVDDVLNEITDAVISALPPQAQQESKGVEKLTGVLREVREALQFANDTPNGPISDTIWMMHRPETLFDFIDAAISQSTHKQEGAE